MLEQGLLSSPQLSVSHLSAGTYLLILKSDANTRVGKFVKE
jgi:hypothetical protein